MGRTELVENDTIDKKESSQIQKTSRQYKDTLFRTLFGDNKRFLELYNAVADDHFPEDTEMIPCPTNSLIARYNDLAFRVGSQLVVFCEHQSTINPNMPLRLLRYLTDILFSFILDSDRLYGETLLRIPTPKFYVLYNGDQKLSNRSLRLSDVFVLKEENPALELVANVIDINYGSGEAALDRSISLRGYSFLIAEVRKLLHIGVTRDEAIVKAIDLCIQQDVLSVFLKEHYGEVIKMLSFEYDAEAEKRVLKEEGRQEGRLKAWHEITEQMGKLLREGMSPDEALQETKKIIFDNNDHGITA